MFAQRLDFLMGLTNTRASALGRACLLDASHISRLRNGSRPLPKTPAFIGDMSLYLARRVRADYQKKALCDALRLSQWPSDEALAAAAVERLLLGEAEPRADVGAILSRFTGAGSPGEIPEGSGAALARARNYYYGPEGKREAVLQFFELIRREASPQTLLLSSDEEMSWLNDDPAFAARWTADFTGLLRSGNRVRIIHSIGRNLNEMIEAVAKWVPLYMTGMIEPYYYRRLRDGVFQRTVFIAPKCAAIVSSSVMQRTDGMLNELITNREAVAALTGEFDNFFAQCRPLVRIMTAREAGELWQTWSELAAAEGGLICMSAAPTLATMPEAVAQAMQERAPESRVLELRRSSAENLEKLLETGRYTELLPETEWDDALPCADFLGAPGLRYTEAELRTHRESAEAMAERSDNCAIIHRNDIPQGLLLYAKEGRGVIMAKTDVPGVAFAISEPNLTNAFWDYLKGRA